LWDWLLMKLIFFKPILKEILWDWFLKKKLGWDSKNILQTSYDHSYVYDNDLDQLLIYASTPTSLITMKLKCLHFFSLLMRSLGLWTPVPYFIEYNAHMSIVCTLISQWFLAKKNYFYFSKIISQEFIIASLFIIKAILIPFLSYLPCIVHRKYFSIIFNT